YILVIILYIVLQDFSLSSALGGLMFVISLFILVPGAVCSLQQTCSYIRRLLCLLFPVFILRLFWVPVSHLLCRILHSLFPADGCYATDLTHCIQVWVHSIVCKCIQYLFFNEFDCNFCGQLSIVS